MRYVLAGFNGSERSRVAVLQAQEIAPRFGGRLHVLMVTRLPSAGIDVAVDDDIVEEVISHATDQLGILRDQLHRGGFPQFALRFGEPALEIARYAIEFGVRDVFLGQTRRMVPRVMSTGWRVGRLLAGTDCRVTIVAAQTLCAHSDTSAATVGANDSRLL
jgi:nucleotide-binding universal stress UspA family protein